ncbi:hypothetical protein A2U01_0089206 [Trifolium medium]|uniref:Uncharacterized protein n=1 Tax=Trifolium medium TaxID=97028 RepID=A0A392U593_9FABA|nr:hypothetical protein [Trifolium medium]
MSNKLCLPRLTADSGIAANPAVAATKANCAALSHPIAASNRSAPLGSRGIDYAHDNFEL